MSGIDFPSILIIAVGLSADCFAVALSGGISRSGFSFGQAFRISLSFGFFQVLMMVLGWLVGHTVIEWVSAYDHWAAFGLLFLVGSRMIWESFHKKEGDHKNADITRGLLLLALSVATSIDALAVGLGFAFLKVNLTLAGITIGIVAFLITLVGFLIGNKVGPLVGKRAEMIGGLVLIVIGVRILLEHLL